MAGIQKLMIVGPCGAGKSTLARELSPQLGLPLLHLDQLFWNSGWVQTPREQWRASLEEHMAREPRWIMDGNYGSSFAMRMPRAQAIVFLDYPRRTYLTRIFRRIWTWRGATRPDMAEGCPERLDGEFLRFAWRFHKTERPKILRALREHGAAATVFWLRHPSQREELVKALVAWQKDGLEAPPPMSFCWRGEWTPEDLSLL